MCHHNLVNKNISTKFVLIYKIHIYIVYTLHMQLIKAYTILTGQVLYGAHPLPPAQQNIMH